MQERKKTALHGTLKRIPLTWKFNSKQLLSKTLNSRMDIIETRAVLNNVKTDRKWAPEGGPEIDPKVFSKGSDNTPDLLLLLWTAPLPTKN